jgi:tRNA (mo5U34)-methyltransferase
MLRKLTTVLERFRSRRGDLRHTSGVRRAVRRVAEAAARRAIPDTPEGAALRARVEAVAFWCHSIDLGSGVTTPGIKTPAHHARELAALALPDLRGKTVLDIGAWDGFYSFVAEERGAARVVACDRFAWALDREAKEQYRAGCQARGVPPEAFDRVEGLWRFDDLPGKRGFDLAHAVRRSRVEPLVADYMALSVESVGPFDVVLYLGVLYHMEDPLAALRRVRALTREVAIIETEAVAIGGFERQPIAEFFPPDAKLAGDPTNFWAPTAPCLIGLCDTAGFGRVELLTEPPRPARGRLARYRLVAHAFVAPPAAPPT